MVKLERSSAAGLIRDERVPEKQVCVYAYVVSKDVCSPNHNTRTTDSEPQQDEFERKKVIQRLVLHPGERRGYWRHYAQNNYKQTIVPALIDDCHARVLLDSGAEVSILDSDFARKIGVVVDATEQLECAGVGGSAYRTEGKARVKLTFAGELAYMLSWVPTSWSRLASVST